MGESKLRRAAAAASPPPPQQEATDMGPVVRRLINLRSYMVADDHVYLYARYLTRVLNPELVPVGFVISTEIALDELARDYRGQEGVPVPTEFRSLVGLPPMAYKILSHYTPKIAQATCPQDFADEVTALFSPSDSALSRLLG